MWFVLSPVPPYYNILPLSLVLYLSISLYNFHTSHCLLWYFSLPFQGTKCCRAKNTTRDWRVSKRNRPAVIYDKLDCTGKGYMCMCLYIWDPISFWILTILNLWSWPSHISYEPSSMHLQSTARVLHCCRIRTHAEVNFI